MRFLLIFLIVIVMFAAAIAVFVVPPDQWQSVLSRFRAEWAPQLAIGGDEAATSAAQSIGTAIPDHRAIRQAAGVPLGDWLYDCDDGAGDRGRPCVIAHQIAYREGGRIVFSWLIGADADGKFQAVWQTPTGVLVNRGVILDAGTEKPIVLPYTACVAGFCEAVANLAPDFIDTLLKTQKASATVYTVSGQALTFPISVDGLADGIVALRNRSRQG